MAKLSADPKGLELEDFVAAHLASRGVFVTSGIKLRDGEEILELDIVWTDYRRDPAVASPIEIKSGKSWGIGDLFKFYGWTRYLSLPAGCFLCRLVPGRIPEDVLIRLCDQLDMKFLHIRDLNQTSKELDHLGLPDPLVANTTWLWRFSFWAQRRLLDSLSIAIAEDIGPESAKAAKEYGKLIRDAVFFETDVRARVGLLFEAHQDHPKLGATMAHEIETGEFESIDPPRGECFRNALYKGQHMPVQSCFYLGHRARLAILKSGVDIEIARDAGTLPKRVLKIFDTEVDLNDSALYAGFTTAMSTLKQLEGFRQLPVLWQTFLWRWGGFLLHDRLDEEYEALAQETGVPPHEVPEALKAFDLLFSGASPWFKDPGGECRRVLMMMPAPIRGIGGVSRLNRYDVESYDQLGLSGDTARRMGIDHDSLVALLERDRCDLAQ